MIVSAITNRKESLWLYNYWRPGSGKEQAKIQQNYRELESKTFEGTRYTLFIGDSIIEYYPLQGVTLTDQYMVNRESEATRQTS